MITVIFSPVVKKLVILPVIVCCDQGEGGEESEQRRQLSMEEEPSQEAAGKHAYISVRTHVHVCLVRVAASIQVGMVLARNFPLQLQKLLSPALRLRKRKMRAAFQLRLLQRRAA